MPDYKTDVFISYAHLDNQSKNEDIEGWISRFHSELDRVLSMRMGEKVNIWRDDKLQGNDQFSDEIHEQFVSTALMISVVSPRYIKSEWCSREVNAFVKQADQSGGVVINNKARIFKVIMYPVPSEEPLPPVMKEMLGYDFYLEEGGTPREMDVQYGQEYGESFQRMLTTLAFEITGLLNQLKTNTPEVDSNDSPDSQGKPVVYLAECSYDIKPFRERLETELRQLGYAVLPEKHLPQSESDYIVEVDQLLKQCQLSIHLVGNQYGAVPDGPSDKSTSALQNQVAVTHSQLEGLRRVVWINEGFDSDHLRQKNFIESLLDDPEAQSGAELIVGSFEDLRTATEAAITVIEDENSRKKLAQSDISDSNVEKQLYLVYTEQDRSAVRELRKVMQRNGINVSTPAFTGAAAQIRASNQGSLTSADIVMIYYGAGDEAWKRSTDTEIRKSQGYRTDNETAQYFTYLAKPSTCDKEDLVYMEEPNIISALDGFEEQSLNSWIQIMQGELIST